ncbi:hypothetical protein MMC18_000615 [Xylographa bjoerkii]|nr:hypothetical protein [Xylographa bjoerkii]
MNHRLIIAAQGCNLAEETLQILGKLKNASEAFLQLQRTLHLCINDVLLRVQYWKLAGDHQAEYSDLWRDCHKHLEELKEHLSYYAESPSLWVGSLYRNRKWSLFKRTAEPIRLARELEIRLSGFYAAAKICMKEHWIPQIKPSKSDYETLMAEIDWVRNDDPPEAIKAEAIAEQKEVEGLTKQQEVKAVDHAKPVPDLHQATS